METPDGWMYTCKLCGKSHEVSDYEGKDGLLNKVQISEVELPCSETPNQSGKYSVGDFVPYRLFDRRR